MINAIKNWWNNKKLSDLEKNKMMVETCCKVFATDDGMIVLNMLLTDLRLFTDAPSEHEKHLNEYAKYFIRERLGVNDAKTLTDFIAQTASETAFETAVSGGGK